MLICDDCHTELLFFFKLLIFDNAKKKTREQNDRSDIAR